MLKRIFVRLLLFGVPFGCSYLALRPAPRPAGSTLVICGYQGGYLTVARKAADCGTPGVRMQTPVVKTLDLR